MENKRTAKEIKIHYESLECREGHYIPMLWKKSMGGAILFGVNAEPNRYKDPK